MDFSKVKQISIPDGIVINICHGEKPLWKKVNLPEGYQLLSYIQTNGSQYIDTGILASSYADGLFYEFHGQVTNYAQSNGNNYLFGCLKNNQRSANISMNTAQDIQKTAVYIGASSSPVWEVALPDTGVDFTICLFASSTDPENITGSLDDIPFTRTKYTASPCDIPSANIYLAWCNGVGSTSLPFWGRIYSFRMTNTAGEPVRNFLPCRRTSDGALGLYDTIERVFYENAGTGTFTAGEVV